MWLKVVFCIVLGVSLHTLAFPTFQDNGVAVEDVDYDVLEDVWNSMPYKRFWSPHPSDYNPLRRPVPPRGSKRDGIAYHPIPRIITMKQRSLGEDNNEEYPENQDVFEGRQKKQTRPTTLIFKLGSWGLRSNSRKQDKGGMVTPSSV